MLWRKKRRVSPSRARRRRWRSRNAFVERRRRSHGAKSKGGTPWIIQTPSCTWTGGGAQAAKRARRERWFHTCGQIQIEKEVNGVVGAPLLMQMRVWINLRLIQSHFCLQRWRLNQWGPEVKSAMVFILDNSGLKFDFFLSSLRSENCSTKIEENP